MAAKTNEQVLKDYQARYHEWIERYFLPQTRGETPPEPSRKDAMLMLELYHIMVEYKRDPMKPLVQTKLAYDADDYQDHWDEAEMKRDMVATLKWWADWKPGALFV